MFGGKCSVRCVRGTALSSRVSQCVILNTEYFSVPSRPFGGCFKTDVFSVCNRRVQLLRSRNLVREAGANVDIAVGKECCISGVSGAFCSPTGEYELRPCYCKIKSR